MRRSSSIIGFLVIVLQTFELCQSNRPNLYYVEQSVIQLDGSESKIIQSSSTTATLPTLSTCPPPELLRPCQCESNNRGTTGVQSMLSCSGTSMRGPRVSVEQTLQRISKRLAHRSKQFDWLRLSNLDELRKLTRNFFAGLRFRNLVIENAPKLQYIHPSAFKLVTNQLRFFYAYNTALDLYRRRPTMPPFGTLRNLTEMHIASKRNICPPKEMIKPCVCTVQDQSLLPFEIKRQTLQLRCVSTRGTTFNVSRIFKRLTEFGHNTNQTEWYFDEVIIRNVTELYPNTFGMVDFAELHIEESPLLDRITANVFRNGNTLQKLRISGTNFASERLSVTFDALNSLPLLRSLFIWSANFEFVPEYAFSRVQPYLKEVVLYGNNIRAIGSYAFSGLSNLDQLRIDGNNIILVDKYTFATNYTSTEPLLITLISNNFRESSFAFMALNGARRPLHIALAEVGGCFWEMEYLDESIFAPFLDQSSNRLYLEPECELKCDLCEMKWLIEMPKHAQRRIMLLPDSPYRENGTSTTTNTATTAAVEIDGYVPCDGGANLFEIYDDIDWDQCI
ncbi:hypothetical protein RDWZM_001676 [Blomia tropicalis]|uniref:Uncharacterized protein n=1 Tax=Blomia tropicalis TaxID=40697 RepID=A0A9Q0RQV2_BLOTA|nr:hypothetical protein RDWZM_001676 [Blomia tropicalis]